LRLLTYIKINFIINLAWWNKHPVFQREQCASFGNLYKTIFLSKCFIGIYDCYYIVFNIMRINDLQCRACGSCMCGKQ
jgi:hypothetical protein